MLRDLLGDDLFFSALRRFFNRHRYDATGTQEFIRMIQEVSPRDLTGFFEPWFESHRLPNVRVSHSTTESAEGGYRLQVRAYQTGQVFVFPLWVEWEESGRKMRRMMVVEARSATGEFFTRSRPEKISVNPDDAVPGEFSGR
jgi:aminopeptidase N